MNDDQSSSDGDELGKSLSATLQHIALLQAKQAKLAAACEAAEEQLLHRLGSAHRNREIDITKLIEVFDHYQALKIAGRSKRWNAHVGINWQSLMTMNGGPNGPAGTWVGEWPCPYDVPIPPKGVSVVYVLYDSTNEPCYVGSTHTFRQRMNQHESTGKIFARWQAHPCRDREHAYEVEDRLLKEHKPRMNQKAGR